MKYCLLKSLKSHYFTLGDVDLVIVKVNSLDYILFSDPQVIRVNHYERYSVYLRGIAVVKTYNFDL